MDKIAEIRRFVHAAELAAKTRQFGAAYTLLSAAHERIFSAMLDTKAAYVEHYKADEEAAAEADAQAQAVEAELDNVTPF
jgi:hypothetical protein